MPSGLKKTGPKGPAPDTLSAAGLPPALPFRTDENLSAAFKQVLGGNMPPRMPEQGGGFSAKATARQARMERPAAPAKGAPGKTHIGPRSGHK
jgi:hypothetical protein